MTSELAYEASDEASENELLDRSLSVWRGWSAIEWEDFTPIALDIHTACSIGQYDWVRSLIARNDGLALDRKNHGGWTPLMYACYIGHDNVVNLLINAGCHMNMKNPRGHTPLILAASCGNESVARTLVRNGAELELTDKCGRTALFHATYAGHQNFVAYLLEVGANSDAVEPVTGMTPFMEAASEGHEIIVQLFLQHGVNVNAKAYNGDMARSLALINGYMKIVSLIDNYNMPLSSLRSEPDLNFYLSSSDDGQSKPMSSNVRVGRGKSKGPSIHDGPEAIARMISRSRNTDESQFTTPALPKGFVAFTGTNEVKGQGTPLCHRDVTSPINPNDYKDSSGNTDFDDDNDESNAFSKTGAITIKSSSSSSGGLIAALGLSREGSIDSDDSHSVELTNSSPEGVHGSNDLNKQEEILKDESPSNFNFLSAENILDSDNAKSFSKGMNLSPIKVCDHDLSGSCKEKEKPWAVVSPLRDYFPMEIPFQVDFANVPVCSATDLNQTAALSTLSSDENSQRGPLPQDNMSQEEIVSRYLNNLSLSANSRRLLPTDNSDRMAVQQVDESVEIGDIPNPLGRPSEKSKVATGLKGSLVSLNEGLTMPQSVDRSQDSSINSFDSNIGQAKIRKNCNNENQHLLLEVQAACQSLQKVEPFTHNQIWNTVNTTQENVSSNLRSNKDASLQSSSRDNPQHLPPYLHYHYQQQQQQLHSPFILPSSHHHHHHHHHFHTSQHQPPDLQESQSSSSGSQMQHPLPHSFHTLPSSQGYGAVSNLTSSQGYGTVSGLTSSQGYGTVSGIESSQGYTSMAGIPGSQGFGAMPSIPGFHDLQQHAPSISDPNHASKHPFLQQTVPPELYYHDVEVCPHFQPENATNPSLIQNPSGCHGNGKKTSHQQGNDPVSGINIDHSISQSSQQPSQMSLTSNINLATMSKNVVPESCFNFPPPIPHSGLYQNFLSEAPLMNPHLTKTSNTDEVSRLPSVMAATCSARLGNHSNSISTTMAMDASSMAPILTHGQRELIMPSLHQHQSMLQIGKNTNHEPSGDLQKNPSSLQAPSSVSGIENKSSTPIPASVMIPGHATSQPVSQSIGWLNQSGRLPGSPNDLREMLMQLGLVKYLDKFEEQDVDLPVFLSLTDNDLKELGIKLFGPRKKMTNAIARWHSKAPLSCSDLEQAYADRLEGEMQEMAIQLNQACANEESLKAQVLQEQQLRSVTEGCLMEIRMSWCQTRSLIQDIRNTMRTTGELLSRLRHNQKELKKNLVLLHPKDRHQPHQENSSKDIGFPGRTSDQDGCHKEIDGSSQKTQVLTNMNVKKVSTDKHLTGENLSPKALSVDGKEVGTARGDSDSAAMLASDLGSCNEKLHESVKKSDKCMKELQQVLNSLIHSTDHILKSTQNISTIEKDIS